MDIPNSDEQWKEEQIQNMLNERRKLKSAGKFKSVKEEMITQNIQASMPHLTSEEVQEQTRWLLWTMCLNDWDNITL
ncbi:MAG TPA: hypothetical protein V6D07_13860 [Trichocoleus sp.]